MTSLLSNATSMDAQPAVDGGAPGLGQSGIKPSAEGVTSARVASGHDEGLCHGRHGRYRSAHGASTDQAGHSVTALARTPSKADQLRAQGADPVTVSIFDTSALTRAFSGHDAVVNLATAQPPTTQFLFSRAWRETERIRSEGSASVVDAALAAGVGRLVQESVSMVYPDRGSAWIDESVTPQRYLRSHGNLAAEESMMRFTREGGSGVVLRLGFFYGPGARHAEQLLNLARGHITPVLGPPNSYLSSIHVADGARAVTAALEVPAGIYNVLDDEPPTKREYAAAISHAVGKRAWISGPGRLALLFGDRTSSLTRSFRVSNRSFKETSGWRPHYPNPRIGWMATAQALREERH